jgi:hypothetical protein
MTLRTSADWLADERYKRIAGILRMHVRARLVRTAGAVDLARRDARKAHTRPFGAPYRTVTIPYARGRAVEALAGWHDCGGKKQNRSHGLPLLRNWLILQLGRESKGGFDEDDTWGVCPVFHLNTWRCRAPVRDGICSELLQGLQQRQGMRR